MKSVSLQCVPCNSLYRLKGTEYPKCLTNLFTAILNFIAGQTISLIFIKAQISYKTFDIVTKYATAISKTTYQTNT